MKNLMYAFAALLVLNGCVVEKRMHSNGYHIKWNKSYRSSIKSVEKHDLKLHKANKKSNVDQADALYAELNNQMLEVVTKSEVNTVEKIEKNQSIKSSILSTKNEKEVSSETMTKEILNQELRTKRFDKKSKNEFAITDLGLIGITTLLGFFAFSVVRKQRSLAYKIAKWAKKNKYQSLGAVIGSELAIIGMAYLSGSHLAKMGIRLSDWIPVISAAGFGLALLAYPRKNNKKLSLNKRYFRQKMVECTLIFSSFMAIQGIGNRIQLGEKDQSVIGYVLGANEFSETEISTADIDFSASEKVNVKDVGDETTDKPNGGLIFLYVFLTVLLGIGMLFTTCALGCFAGLGLGGIGGAILGIALGLLGIFLTVLAMVKLGKAINNMRPGQHYRGMD